MQNYKIAVAGTGYVGLSYCNSVELASPGNSCGYHSGEGGLDQ